jgi:stage V sporulation protein R
MVWQYYVKSKKAADYKKMLHDSLYHPPHITFRAKEGILRLHHHFEGKPLVREFIENTLVGIEYLWGGQVELLTSEPLPAKSGTGTRDEQPQSVEWKKIRYIMHNRKLTRREV